MAVTGTTIGRLRYYDWPLMVIRLVVANGGVIGRSFKVTVK